MAFFCNHSGVRIMAPGVSKDVDPVNGQENFVEPASPEGGSETKPDKGGKKGDKPEKEPPASPEGGSETKPDKGSK
jgi:hypothetical protein